MVTLKGNIVYLRALEQKDLNFLYELENNTLVWEISGTVTPYSKDVLQLYLDNAHRDIYDVKQLRLVICNLEHKTIGLIDLFDFDPYHKRAGLGIVIHDEAQRNKGVGAEAISLLCNYVFQVLGLRQVYANILEDNIASMHLFQKLGFIPVGVKKDWVRVGSTYKNEILLQKLNT
ncbi:diamine N-acetyltransferase [Maribacter sedimenticola]|uniref:Diamine N-acetyltransferase n=1 Tax=Maribacter sedimenticola TaxID=228956 RepID=A0ABY1SFZ4_9FLAO|nr:GNAT family N-acetyltransferase [Maribacter sedimenticola]SNR43790.1 diamine N-acetyltransferase [Maribacter sedimenticola]